MTDEQMLLKLAVAYKVLRAKEVSLKPGDLVTWREGLKNKRFPDYGQPAIVLDVLDSPITDYDNDIASQYYGEQLNVRVGFFDDNDDFVAFLFDGRRFQILESDDGKPANAEFFED